MGARPKFASVEEYLGALTPEQRAGIDALRGAVRAELPADATEQISYQIIGYRVGRRVIVWLAAFADHFSLFPYTDAVREQLRDEVEPLLSGKGTVRLPADEPLPLDLVRRIVRILLAEAGAAPR